MFLFYLTTVLSLTLTLILLSYLERRQKAYWALLNKSFVTIGHAIHQSWDESVLKRTALKLRVSLLFYAALNHWRSYRYRGLTSNYDQCTFKEFRLNVRLIVLDLILQPLETPKQNPARIDFQIAYNYKNMDNSGSCDGCRDDSNFSTYTSSSLYVIPASRQRSLCS